MLIMIKKTVILALISILCKLPSGQQIGQPIVTVENLRVEGSGTGRVGADIHINADIQDMTTNITENITITAILSTDNELIRIHLQRNDYTTEANGSILSYEFQLTDIAENINYTLTIELNYSNGTVTTAPLPFLTTSVQRLTVGVIESDRATISCHFLLGTRADGCLVQWVQTNNLQEGKSINRSEILITRADSENVSSLQIASLWPETKYMVEAFSVRGKERLHRFGIPLEGGLETLPTTLILLTTTAATNTEERRLVIIFAAIFTGFFVLASIVTSIIVVLAANKIRKVKHRKYLLSMRQMYFDSSSTDTSIRFSGRESPEINGLSSQDPFNRTSLQGSSNHINEEDFALEMNVCYEPQHKPPSKTKNVQDMNDTESLHIYDDIITFNKTVSHSQQKQDIALATPFNHVTQEKMEVKSHGVMDGASESISGVPQSAQISQVPVINLNNDHNQSKILSREESGTYVDVQSPPYENVDPVDGSPRPLEGGHSFLIPDWTEGPAHAYAQLECGEDEALSECLPSEESQFLPQPYEIPISTQPKN